MKKIFLALTLVLGLTTASFAQNNLKFAHVDYSKVVDSLPSKISADKEMKIFIEGGQKTIEELQTLLQRDYDVYLKDKETRSAIANEIMEKNLSEQQAILENKQASLQKDLETYNDRLYTPIEKSFKKAVKIISDKHKLNYVFEANSLLFLNGGFDITTEVKAELIKLEKARLSILK